jgi:hypothetical protein
MKHPFSKIGFAFILTLLIVACTPVASPVVITEVVDQPEPTATSPQPTHTPDAQLLIEGATLFRADFEDGDPIGLYDSSQRWHIDEEDDGNSVFCNELSDEWSSFQFGLDEWENYAVSLRAKFLSANEGQSAETYIRINQSMEGYRASVWNNESATIGFYPPPSVIGESSLIVNQDEWYQVELQFVEDNLKYYIDDELQVEVSDDRRSSGRAGFGAGPNTEVCVDDIVVWGLDEKGYPIESSLEPTADPRSIYEGDCVFCFVNGSDPSMPIWDTESDGYTHQQADLREQIILDETFAVEAGEEVLFENQIVWIRPNQRQDIEVRGTLIIRDSLLLWDQTEHQQTRLRIINGGELIIEDSYAFGNNQYWVNWDFEDGSTISFDHFVGDPWTSIEGSVSYKAVNYSTVSLTLLNNTHDTTVNVSDAHHLWFELFPSPGEHEISLPEKGQWVDWELIDLWPNTVVTVTDSLLHERDVSLSNDTHVTVLDTPSGFSLGWAIYKNSPGFVDCVLHDLGDPEEDEGVFYENRVWDLPCNNSSLTVRNSVMQRTWPVTWGYVHLRIHHSNLVDPRNFGGPATMEIYDSTIDHVAAYQEGRVYIENCRIQYDIEVKDRNSIIYGFDVLPRDEDGSIEVIEVDGGTYVELESPGPPW